MATFTTNIRLGEIAYALDGTDVDLRIRPVTVGRVTVTRTLPRARTDPHQSCYVEECMCLETGVGSGQVYTVGRNIWATASDAEAGLVAAKQRARDRIAAHEARLAEANRRERERDLAELHRLQQMYSGEKP